MRRRLIRSALCLVAGTLMMAPATAQAQFFFPFMGFGGGMFGENRSSLYNRGFSPFFSYGYSPYFGNSGPMYGGMMNAYGGYNPMMGNPYFNASFSGQLALPGPTSSGYAPRMRATENPALAVGPYSPILAAAYSPPETDGRAHIEIVVPDADAEVWLQNTQTKQTGTVRNFVSPPLEARNSYSYDIRATWGGHTETRHLGGVRAGDHLVVDFTKKAGR